MDPFRTLLLNGSYEPLSSVCWERAFGLILLEKVDVVEAYEETVCSPSRCWSVPAVIRMRRYVRLPWRPPPFNRQNVFARDGYRCQYCQEVGRSRDLTLDHVIPRSRGGPRSWGNVVTCCARCNRRKRDRTPKEARMKLLKTPRLPHWAQFAQGDMLTPNMPEEWEPYLRVA